MKFEDTLYKPLKGYQFEGKVFLYYAQSGEFCKENLQLVTCLLEMFFYILTQEVYNLFFLCYTEFYFRDLF